MELKNTDKNFLSKRFEKSGITYKNAREEPFRIYGLSYENGRFVRIPQAVADTVNPDLAALNPCTAGGRIRFVTDSKRIAVTVKYNVITRVPHMSLTGSAGLDLYDDGGEGDLYAGTFISDGESDSMESVLDFPSSSPRTVTIHLPLYSGLDDIFIGLDTGASLKRAADYKIELPIVIYGSSITQGGCASRPGNAYGNILSRLLSCDHTNLGFSGSARGEESIADYIASLKMSAFILDYDYNAPTAEHLEATHRRFFEKVRASHPNIPIILLSRPDFHLLGDARERLKVISDTFFAAKASGDENVYFIPGNELFDSKISEIATVDGIHPNDCGFSSMAFKLYDLLSEIL